MIEEVTDRKALAPQSVTEDVGQPPFQETCRQVIQSGGEQINGGLVPAAVEPVKDEPASSQGRHHSFHDSPVRVTFPSRTSQGKGRQGAGQAHGLRKIQTLEQPGDVTRGKDIPRP